MASHGESMLSRPGGLVFPSAHVFITRSMPAIGLENPEGDMLHIYNMHASAPNKSCVIFDHFLDFLAAALGFTAAFLFFGALLSAGPASSSTLAEAFLMMRRSGLAVASSRVHWLPLRSSNARTQPHVHRYNCQCVFWPGRCTSASSSMFLQAASCLNDFVRMVSGFLGKVPDIHHAHDAYVK